MTSTSSDLLKTGGNYTKDLSIFESVVPLQKAELKLEDGTTQNWEFYALGQEHDFSLNIDPIVFLPSEALGAEAFFYEVDALSAKDYKTLSVNYEGSAHGNC